MTDPDITLSEQAGVRYLHFGSVWVQGAMRMRRPWHIEIAYVALMQSWLLFLEPPKRLLQIGLGAAALTKHCYKNLPNSAITAVESSGAVVAAARRFFALPEDDSRLTVLADDGSKFLNKFLQKPKRKAFGILQVDVYDQEARGPVLDSLVFYQQCFDALDEPGILSVNLFGEAASYARNIKRIQEVFHGRVLTWPAVDAGNIVVLAFKGPKLEVSWQSLFERARALESAYDLPAQKWLRNLKNHPAQTRASTTHLSL